MNWQFSKFECVKSLSSTGISPFNHPHTYTTPSSLLTSVPTSEVASDDDSQRFGETSFSMPLIKAGIPVTSASSFSIPKIRIRRQETIYQRSPFDSPAFHDGLLHATDTCFDFASRIELNRRKSFIEHIRETAAASGIGETSSRAVKREKRKRNRHVSKYLIGLSSDEDEIEEMLRGDGIELRPSKRFSRFLTVGTSSHTRGCCC